MVRLVNVGREFRRQTRGLSYRDMARETGISPSTCWRIHWHQGVSGRTLEKMDAYLERIGFYDAEDAGDTIAHYQPKLPI